MGSVTEQAIVSGTGRMPTTAAGAERAFALLIVGGRLGTVIQMAPSLPQGMSSAPSGSAYLLVWLLAAGTAVGVSAIVWRHGQPLPPRAYVGDAVICVAVLLLGLAVVPEETRLGTWTGYQGGYAISVLCSGAAVRSHRVWLGALVAIVCAYVAFALPILDGGTAGTIVGNILTLVVLAGVGRWVALYVRAIAEDGDRARAQALELGRRDEERRAQLAIHNGAALIRMLGDPDLDDRARAMLQGEAQREAGRMRSYLTGRSGSPSPPSGMPSAPVPLPLAVDRVCGRFADLPIHATLDLADEVVLDKPAAAALDHALASVLLNVRDHSGAQNVVIHADVDPEDAKGSGAARPPWVLTVHDDGVGFRPDPSRYGVGLREVVIGQLEPHGVAVDVASTVGLGTTVTFHGRPGA